MKLKLWGIQRRAVFLALAPAAVIAVALTAYFLILRYDDVEAALQNRGQSLVRQLAPAAEYGAFSGNRNELLRLVQATVREPDVSAVAIYDIANRLLASAGKPSPLGDISKLPDGHQRIPGNHSVQVFQSAIKRPVLPFDDPFQAAATASVSEDKPLGLVVLELSRANLEARKQEILVVTLLTTVFVLAAALLLAYRLGRDITEPVLALEDAVARVRAGTPDVRIPPHRSGTLVSLETGFNEMAAALDVAHRRSANALAHSEAELARQLEIAQAKKEEAEHASEGKSRFLAAASHDLRQPLHALTLFATELSATAGKSNRRLASQIVTAAAAMAELLDALLEVSRLDLAAIQPQRRAVPLGPLLETIADAHRQSAKIKGLRLICRPSSLWVDTDPHLLRRMVGNLVANSVRYTNNGGVLLAARARGGEVRIDVWDTGVGIDADHLPYLFHEFYQVDNPERDAAKGLGLGLAIVARLGKILDHPVNVHSTPGHGSVFSVRVPRTAPESPVVMEPLVGLAFRARVAVRTDDINHCGDICNLLDAWGYARECACSDEELPQLLATEPAVL
ncbi:MAG TPA: ATP-binding protein, partial [Rhodocyclaceae bacterium]|nr:ATP-binding protein [Rhodocyclaceae bacterium]